MDTVTRTGISFDPKLLQMFDKFLKEHGYSNRSEAINDMIREKLEHSSTERIVGTMKVIYDHHVGHYSKNVSTLQHDYHCQIVSSMHTYVDHHNCLEMIVVKGKLDRIKKLFEKIKSTKGVRKAELVLER